MNTRIVPFLLGCGALAPILAATPPAGGTMSFVACPIYRDVDQGIKSGCWLADDPASGIRFDVTHARSKPQWGREVLVEGIVAADADACGGTVLEPVRISVLDSQCNKHMLPAEGYVGRKFALPAETMQQSWVPRPVPEPPFTPRRWDIYFDFNSNFPLYQYSEVIMEKIAAYANAAKPARVRITGYAATDDYVVNGLTFKEELAVAEARARKIGIAMERLGVPAAIIDVSWHGGSQPTAGGDEGLMEPSRRRVTIAIEF